ncbi:MAG TPA: hypothetical protein VK914_10375 [bacterium]|jgi:hypothetical protein|nr:hypothetical protein [bacterium]
MFDSPILDLALGMIFVYLIMSVLSSALKELLAQGVNLRAVVLADAVKKLLQDADGTGLTADFYRHPLITVLAEPRSASWQKAVDPLLPAPGLPDNIPPATFAAALSDLIEDGAVQGLLRLRDAALANSFGEDKAAVLAAIEKARACLHEDRVEAEAQVKVLQGIAQKYPELGQKLGLDGVFSGILEELNGGVPRSVEGLAAAVAKLPAGALRRTFRLILQKSAGNAAALQMNLVQWFNNAMDKASDLYKRMAQVVIFALALVLAVALNVDTLSVTKNLWKDKHLRDVAAASAAQSTMALPAQDPGAEENLQAAGSSLAALRSADIPMGWNLDPSKSWWQGIQSAFASQNNGLWVLTWLGWLLTALAASLGAPFWFDAMAKFLSFKDGTGK